jgi:hypothetical protein
MSKLIIAAVPITMIDLIFPKCIPHLERVIEKAPDDINLEGIERSFKNGSRMLVTVSEGDQVIACNVLETCTHDTGHKVLYIPITGGDRLDEWMDRFLEIANAIALDLGCHELRGIASRAGWLRMLKAKGHDWYRLHEVVGCKVKQINEEKS